MGTAGRWGFFLGVVVDKTKPKNNTDRNLRASHSSQCIKCLWAIIYKRFLDMETGVTEVR